MMIFNLHNTLLTCFSFVLTVPNEARLGQDSVEVYLSVSRVRICMRRIAQGQCEVLGQLIVEQRVDVVMNMLCISYVVVLYHHTTNPIHCLCVFVCVS